MAYREGDGGAIGRAAGGHWTAPAEAAVPSIVTALPRINADDEPPRERPLAPHLPRCPEIDCVRSLLPANIAALVELQAAESNDRADRLLIAWGAISEDAYVHALAASLGIDIEPLDEDARPHAALAGDKLVEAARTGMLALHNTGDSGTDGMYFAVVPRLVDSRRLIAAARSGHDLARRIRLTTAARLQSFVAHHGIRTIEYRATQALRDRRPDLSANAGIARPIAIGFVAAAAVAGIAAPGPALIAAELTLGLVFLAWAGLRFLGMSSSPLPYHRAQPFSDNNLPIYTVIVALYREAVAVKSLVAALRDLNYPPEKLDIKFAVEPDDHETRAAITALRLDPPFEVVVAPRGGPRTKPKALNAALQFARGEYVAIYDAEDIPDPDQLRRALDAFNAADHRLACVQACLTIDNTDDSWLTRMFTAEYAGLFDVFLPGLAAWRLPLPLGGSSNHFRTAVLRQVGAWDPYNVTEDADLGVRLARFGYRSTVIPSTTYEEAPARFGPWLRQRTRWFKGWMQTWQVHTRAPARLLRELGWPGFATFQLIVGGTVLAALVHALFAIQVGLTIAAATPEDTMGRIILGVHISILLTGYAISAALGVVGLKQRRLSRVAWALLLMPIYWVLLSIAAWRALFQLVRAPTYWEKTAHGLARTSRLAGPKRTDANQSRFAIKDSA
jgi:cellulose synthase/poly-beta-1,6-N-acetylglucosamine synthase-like glycosyltransferase